LQPVNTTIAARSLLAEPMIRRFVLCAVALAVASEAALALLPPVTTIDEFLRLASCAALVEVTATDEMTTEELRSLKVPEADRARLNRAARLRVRRWLVEGGCRQGSEERILLFSTEVHSAHPEPGHGYVLFPRALGNAWAEAVYGRSLWEVTDDQEVVVEWRNDFLVTPLELRSGESASVPLSAVERLLKRPSGDRRR
jgi:hypothetical protein